MKKPKKRKREDGRSQFLSTTAVASRLALYDCRIACDEFARTDWRGPAWRIRWVAAVTLLRIVGHVLSKVDAKRSMPLKQAIENAWTFWKIDEESSALFFGFIDNNRNNILKEYRIRDRGHIVGVDESDAYDKGDFKILIRAESLTPHQTLMRCTNWWTSEIDKIENDATEIKFRMRTFSVAE